MSLFTRACSDRLGLDINQIRHKSRFTLDISKAFFTMKVVRQWNRLPREAVEAPSLEVLKVGSDGALGNLV